MFTHISKPVWWDQTGFIPLICFSEENCWNFNLSHMRDDSSRMTGVSYQIAHLLEKVQKLNTDLSKVYFNSSAFLDDLNRQRFSLHGHQRLDDRAAEGQY